MTSRFTQTEKWEDPWYRKLKPNEKLLFNYICDKCDIAGFWEVDLEFAAIVTQISPRAIRGAFEGLCRAYISNGTYIWLRNFIRHQKNWPLNPKNNAHRAIIARLDRHPEFQLDFQEELSIANLVVESSPSLGAEVGATSPPGKGKGKGKGKEGEILKAKHGDFVLLTPEEYDKLVAKFGKDGTQTRITELNEGIGSKGYKYESHYYTILSWDRKRKKAVSQDEPRLYKEIQA